MSTTPSDLSGVELDVSQRTNVRTIALSGAGGITAIVYFALQALAQRATESVTGIETPDQGPPFPILGLFFAVILIRSLYDVASWVTRTYTVGDRELVIDEGILTRHHRVVPYARVQQVDVHQPLVAQALDIAELRIDTAGEGGLTTMRLRALRRSDSEQLRAYILERRAALQRDVAVAAGSSPLIAAPAHGPSSAPERVLLTVSPARLVAAALTHSTVVVGLPLVLVAALWLLAFGAIATRESGAAMGGGALLLIGLAGTFVLLSRVYGMVIGHWSYTLSVAGDDIHLRYGLLDVRQLTIPRRRVQQVTVVDNPLRRALGVASLTMHSAAGPGGGGNEGPTRFEVPLLERAAVDEFLAAMMGTDAWRHPRLEARPPQAKRRAIVRRCALLALVALVPAIAWFPYGCVAFAFAVVGVPWGLVAHRRAGHGCTTTLVVFSRGVLHHLIELVPISRVQSARTESNPLQRASGLATLHVDIAGDRSAPRLYDMRAATASTLVRTLPRVSSPTGAARRDTPR